MKPFRLNVDRRHLELLDWPLIQERITQACFFEHNKFHFETSPFLMSDCIEQEHQSISKLYENLDQIRQAFSSSLHGCPSDEESFSQMFKLQKGLVLTPKTANLAAHIIEVFLTVSKLTNLEGPSRQYDSDIKTLKKSFLKPFRQFVNRYGHIQSEKHPKLASITQGLDLLNIQLRKMIQQTLKSEPYSRAIQFEQYDIIDERYVIPIRSDHYQAHLGTIVARSQSGMTLFVEPPELREIANKRLHLIAKREEVINRIFIELSSGLTENYKVFEQLILHIQKLDLLISKTAYCESLNLVRPSISNDRSFHLTSFFHPLLERPVVNDLEFSKDYLGMVISGPNTGGKTVSLKSLALCQLFLHAGLFIPAERAHLPLASSLYYFSHDHQDISLGLSSFSSEVTQYINLLEQIDDNAFIFIDEIFNSTSSEEASALALGLLDYIHERNDVHLFLSTHHQLLKTIMHSRKQYLSCHVGHDFKRDRPTYKLQYHSPGSSLALSIFKKLTLNSSQDLAPIFHKASHYLDKKQASYESLLEQLSSQKTELQHKIQEVHILKNELKYQKKSSDGILFLEREKIKNRFKDEIEQVFKDAEDWSISFKRELETTKNTKKSIDKIRKQKSKTLNSLDVPTEHTPINLSAPDKGLGQDEIEIGKYYFCHLTNSNVLISQMNTRKGKVQVKSKGKSLWVPYNSLTLADKNSVPQVQKVQININKKEAQHIEVDGRGLRLEEFQKVIFPTLDNLICGDIPYCDVIHGHGNGVLKEWLRNYLERNSNDFEWSSHDGNDGVTTIKLRSS